jgi:hypothetical protein
MVDIRLPHTDKTRIYHGMRVRTLTYGKIERIHLTKIRWYEGSQSQEKYWRC